MVNSTKLRCDCNRVSCGCNAAKFIKLDSRTYVSPIYANTFAYV